MIKIKNKLVQDDLYEILSSMKPLAFFESKCDSKSDYKLLRIVNENKTISYPYWDEESANHDYKEILTFIEKNKK